MSRPVQLRCFEGIEEIAAGEGLYRATGPCPWLELEFADGPPGGAWIELGYSTSWLDPVVRVVLRTVMPSGESFDTMLPGAVFGSAIGMACVPAGCRQILLSPATRPGALGFELDFCRIVPARTMFARAFLRDPGRTLTAIGARALGARLESTQALQWAMGGTALAHYGAYRAARERPPDPDGLDRLRHREDELPEICLIDVGEAGPDLSYRLRVSSRPRGAVADGGVAGPAEPMVCSHAPAQELLDGLDPSCLVLFGGERDRLTPAALRVVAHVGAEFPDVDVFYGDEEILAPDNSSVWPILKPDWCPVRNATIPYLGRAVFFRVRMLGAVGQRCGAGELAACARRELQDPASSWRVRHIRRILLTGPSEGKPPSGPVNLARASPAPAGDLQGGNVHAPLQVSVVIPTRDRVDLLRNCLDGLKRLKERSRLDVIIVDNGSREAATEACYASLASDPSFRILRQPGPFNFSKLCNAGAAAARGDLLLFLNNDISMPHDDWLDRLIPWARRPDVGAVGSLLLFPDGTIQHAGVVIGMGGLAGHVDLGKPGDWPGYLSRLGGVHEVGAVTGACLAVDKAKFDAIGGFDETRFPVDLNDVDLCLRLARRGWKSLLVPDSVLVHHESASRGRAIAPNSRYHLERSHFARTWLEVIRGDPHFHPALSLFSTGAALA